MSVPPSNTPRRTCFVLVGLLCCLTAVPASEKPTKKVTLTRNGTSNSFDFETEQMKGTLRLDGDYPGVSRLIDKRSGRQVVDPRYSMLNLFRVFAVNLGLGTPRGQKGTVKAEGDWAEVTWPAREGNQTEITARYQVREPNIVDLTVTVKSRGVYRGFEILMPSYFDRSMVPYVYLKRRGPGSDWVLPTVNDAFRGGVLAFPRDEHAAGRCVDGRWSRSEYNMPTVHFFPVRHYAEPVGVMTDPERKVGAILMAKRRHCSGFSARYHAEKKEDRLTDYSAIDLTLFGDDLVAGDERTAQVRLALMHLDGDLERALQACRAFNKK
jgi:hypothetical protein